METQANSTVLITVPTLAAAGMEYLRSSGCKLIFISKAGGVTEMIERLKAERVDAVICRTLPFSAEAIAAAPYLKVISRHGVGYDGIDIAAATQRGIPVLIAPAANATSVAELTIGLMLAAARSVPRHDAAIRAGVWDRAQVGLQLSGRTLGLVGLGTIGRIVARMAGGIGMRVIAYDPYARVSAGESCPVELVGSLDALLKCSNVVSLHCPLTDETRNIIGAAQLARMPKGSILVNAARGALVDDVALTDALRKGHLAAAGLDTVPKEPLPEGHPYRGLTNLVMTPHMGGSTDAALDSTSLVAAEHALAVLKGLPIDPAVCVNQSVLKK
jgi:D-3-phosphoglycerate dehydrogenase